MPLRSTLALIQQITTILLIAGALAWLGWWWGDSPPIALAGFFSISLAYSGVLALEFMMLRFVGRTDPAPRPSRSELMRAWLSETARAPLVFCWQQPFRWRAVPDQLEVQNGLQCRGVVFIHGLVCNRGFWNPWLAELAPLGHPFSAINLEPVFGSIEEYVPVIEAAVQRVTRVTGLPPVLVCHSMGGVAARAWLRAMSAHARVHRIITIGSPHHGTWLARFSHLKNGRQMRLHSPWLRELEQPYDDSCSVEFTCWYSNCDNIVFPVSTATLAGADNRLIRRSARGPGVSPHGDQGISVLDR